MISLSESSQINFWKTFPRSWSSLSWQSHPPVLLLSQWLEIVTDSQFLFNISDKNVRHVHRGLAAVVQSQSEIIKTQSIGLISPTIAVNSPGRRYSWFVMINVQFIILLRHIINLVIYTEPLFRCIFSCGAGWDLLYSTHWSSSQNQLVLLQWQAHGPLPIKMSSHAQIRLPGAEIENIAA